MRPLHDGEWASQDGLLATRPQWTAADLLCSREDPEAVAQVVADPPCRGQASPSEFGPPWHPARRPTASAGMTAPLSCDGSSN